METQVDNLTYVRAGQFLEGEVDGEIVALDIAGGKCFGFNSVASSVWRALESPRAFWDLVGTLQAEFEVSFDQCSLELRELLADMVKRGLVRPS